MDNERVFTRNGLLVDFLESENRLNNKMKNEEFRNHFYENPLAVLKEEGFELLPENQAELVEFFGNFCKEIEPIKGAFLQKTGKIDPTATDYGGHLLSPD